MSGKNKNYKHGRKNQWRNWAWKEIAKRVEDVKNAKVLYLAARSDLDRGVAVRHGFSPDNMFAIDKDVDVASELRERNVNAMCGDIFECAYSGIKFFDVLYFDLCCGVNEKLINFVVTSLMVPNTTTVVLINVMRGRDKYIKKIKSAINTEYKPRNALIYQFIRMSFLRLYWYDGFAMLNDDNAQQVFSWVDNKLSPVVRSYTGNKVIMDSLIYKVPKILSRSTDDIKFYDKMLARKHSFSRHLSAAKAISTMRKNGTLPSSPRW